MCGIAGIFGGSESIPTLDAMLEKLKHRGPDDIGTYHSEEVALAHARLSIIDVERGKQPIFNEDETMCIVFNGEIYNCPELRQRLSGRHSFKTNTDTEVILHLYEELGEECVRDLNGDFAFAIYSSDGLFLARDPLGIKPLYISRHDGLTYFASEMKALLGIVPVFEEFPAGHSYHSEHGFKKYFTIPASQVTPMTIEEVRDGIRFRLETAVQRQLMSDVPLGVFLSGGLDSSIIAAIARRHIPDLNTFSVGMPGSEDRRYAHMVSEYLETRHHEHEYTLDEMLSVLPEVIYHLESYDAALVRSAIPNYFLARLASKHVKVVLSGEGADELFSGYHYLKEIGHSKLHKELVDITNALHNTNLQRTDRMTMAHGIEGRVPFLDVDLVRFAFTIPVDLKLGPDDTEKWILREAFKEYLPDEIVYRRKSKFSEGCGSSLAMKHVADERISDREFERSATLPNGSRLSNKEELMYYRIFREFYPVDAAYQAVGSSRSL
jgi:asparagine synthase (glutamine-hydrolysing)